jgi:hypothetical protein
VRFLIATFVVVVGGVFVPAFFLNTFPATTQPPQPIETGRKQGPPTLRPPERAPSIALKPPARSWAPSAHGTGRRRQLGEDAVCSSCSFCWATQGTIDRGRRRHDPREVHQRRVTRRALCRGMPRRHSEANPRRSRGANAAGDSSVAVGAAARQDAQDVDGAGGLLAGEAHAPVTDPKPPLPLNARQATDLPARRLRAQAVQRGDHTPSNLLVKASEVAFCGRVSSTRQASLT